MQLLNLWMRSEIINPIPKVIRHTVIRSSSFVVFSLLKIKLVLMKKIIFLSLSIFVGISSIAQNFEWVKGMTGNGFNSGFDVATDDDGNVYSIGDFEEMVDFDPNEGTSTITSYGQKDVYVQKLDADGNLVWATYFGGVSNDHGSSIAVSNSGHVYTVGRFFGEADFDQSAKDLKIQGTGLFEVFIAKQTSAGELVWVKSLAGDNSTDFGNALAIDDEENLLITGHFSYKLDADPGDNEHELVAKTLGKDDIYTVKLDSSGSFLWASSIGGDGDDRGLDVDIDSDGNVYTTGWFRATTDFDPSNGEKDTFNLTSAGKGDIFIQKLDKDGHFVWAKGMGSDQYDYGSAIKIDNDGNVLLTGSFDGTVDFNPNTGVENHTANGIDVYVLKLDGNGEYIWSKTMSGRFSNWGHSVTSDEEGNVYVFGEFEDTIDMDPGMGVKELVSRGKSEMFMLKLNSDGDHIWSKSIGSSQQDIGRSIHYSSEGTLLCTGTYYGEVDFDPGTGISMPGLVNFNRPLS